jgi:hypothetical protein
LRISGSSWSRPRRPAVHGPQVDRHFAAHYLRGPAERVDYPATDSSRDLLAVPPLAHGPGERDWRADDLHDLRAATNMSLDPAPIAHAELLPPAVSDQVSR